MQPDPKTWWRVDGSGTWIDGRGWISPDGTRAIIEVGGGQREFDQGGLALYTQAATDLLPGVRHRLGDDVADLLSSPDTR